MRLPKKSGAVSSLRMPDAVVEAVMLSPSTSSWKLQVAVSRSTPVQRWSKWSVTLGSFSASESNTLFNSRAS